jgi:uncharacterized membrane protein
MQTRQRRLGVPRWLNIGVGLALLGGEALATRMKRRSHASPRRGVHVANAVTVRLPPEAVYRLWRDLESLPRLMSRLESMTAIEERSRSRTKAPAETVEREALIVDDRPNELIAWRSSRDSQVENQGVVRFSPAPGDRGTEIVVDAEYHPRGGALGAWAARLMGREPGQLIDDDLRRFKQSVETGEVVNSDASMYSGPHAARPPEMRAESAEEAVR